MFARTVTPDGLRRGAALTALAGACLLGLPADATADGTQTLSVELVASSVPEGADAKLTFLVKLSAGPDSATFDYAATGTASAGADYTPTAKSAETVAAGGTVTVDVPVVDDALDEDAETVRLDVTNVVGAANSAAAATGTIEDDDAPPTVQAIVDPGVTVEEATTVPVTVNLSGESGKTITIDYRVGEGSTATDGLDFTLAGTQLAFAPGQTSKSVVVQILEDTRFEARETAFVIFFGHSNVQPGSDVEGRVTIDDDGDPPAAPTVPPAQVVEGDPVAGEPATTDLVFMVSLAGPRPMTIFNYRTVAGTAGASDFEGGGAVVLPESSLADPPPVPVTIKVTRDAVDELDETVTLELLNPTTGLVAASAVGTILNDDENSLLSVGDTSADEPTTGTATMEFTITLAPASERTVGVTWATADGTATAGVDYTAAAGSVTFEPGETAEKVQVTLLGDGVNEENETLALVLSAPTMAKLVDADGLGTLVDKNAPPSLSISDTTAREGVGASLTVTLAGTTLRTVRVGFGTVDGVAKAGSDYVPRVGTLTFAPGEKTKTLEVTVTDDDVPEPSEDFSIRLGDAVNATVTKASGRATIEASDQGPASAPTSATSPPAQKRAPAVVQAPRMLLGPRTVRVGGAGIARMTVTCRAASPIACSGIVQLERAAKPLLKLGQRGFSVRKGAKGVVPVKLSARALGSLRRQGSMRARVIVLYKTSVGSGRAVPGVVTLLWVAPKRTP